MDSWATAIAIYTLAYGDGTIEAIPIAGGDYDHPFFTIPSLNGRQGTALFNIPQPGPRSDVALSPEQLCYPEVFSGTFYIVLHGEEPGIFGTW